MLCNVSLLVSTQKKNKYISLSYTNNYYNNNPYTIGNLFLPVCCVCVPGGSRSLLKLSQAGKCWDVGRSWERCWGIFFSENNGRTAMVQGDILILE